MSRWLVEKLRRLRAGEPPRVLDLFAGCGGLSLGCELAGAQILAGIELDSASVRTYGRNFHSRESAEQLAFHSTPRDIVETDPAAFVRSLQPRKAVGALVDVIVAGPPCQAFARVGRAKLREIMQHPEAFLRDPRATLYQQVLRYVETLSPVAILIENVPDVLNYGGINLFEAIAVALDKLGYSTRYSLLNAVHYGVPQMRYRGFLVAVSHAADTEPRLPSPTHGWVLPRGYQGTRDVALRNLDLFSNSYYVNPGRPADSDLRPAVTARSALGDLPPITDHLRGAARKVPQRLDKPLRLVDTPPPNDFVRLMRNWPNHESAGVVYDHVIRFLPRDFAIFARMRPGDQYPEAYELATRMRDEHIDGLERDLGRPLKRSEREAVTRKFVPPYDPGKFPNKWRKMEEDAPARTLMAHLGKDTYSHIHYDSSQSRPISVREAARLQSFPDGFRYAGTMNPAFRQIGNAVPPLLAYAVFRELRIILAGLGFDREMVAATIGR